MLDPDIVISYIQNFLSDWGLFFVFFIAFLESLVLIGSYIPGTIIVFGALSTMSSNITEFIFAGLLATLGIYLGYAIDFYIGRKYGKKIIIYLNIEKYSEMIKDKIHKKGLIFSFLFFCLPGVGGGGSLASLIMGSMHLDYKKFISIVLPSVVIWNMIWGILIYYFGSILVESIIRYLPFVIISVLLIIMYKNRQNILEEFKNNISKK